MFKGRECFKKYHLPIFYIHESRLPRLHVPPHLLPSLTSPSPSRGLISAVSTPVTTATDSWPEGGRAGPSCYLGRSGKAGKQQVDISSSCVSFLAFFRYSFLGFQVNVVYPYSSFRPSFMPSSSLSLFPILVLTLQWLLFTLLLLNFLLIAFCNFFSPPSLLLILISYPFQVCKKEGKKKEGKERDGESEKERRKGEREIRKIGMKKGRESEKKGERRGMGKREGRGTEERRKRDKKDKDEEREGE